MLWLNVILDLNFLSLFLFFFFFGGGGGLGVMVMYDNEVKTKGNKI